MLFPPSFELNDTPEGAVPVGAAVLDSCNARGERDGRVRLIVLTNDRSTSVREYAAELRGRLNAEPRRVLIEVRRGVVEVAHRPAGVDVLVIDHDNCAADEPDDEDEFPEGPELGVPAHG